MWIPERLSLSNSIICKYIETIVQFDLQYCKREETWKIFSIQLKFFRQNECNTVSEI